jgi:hypothetical protein
MSIAVHRSQINFGDLTPYLTYAFRGPPDRETMQAEGGKPFCEVDMRAAIELWKTNISFQRMREQLRMSTRDVGTSE